ncbi:hypothetical protein ACHMW9_15735 [Mesorhizobium terrae]
MPAEEGGVEGGNAVGDGAFRQAAERRQQPQYHRGDDGEKADIERQHGALDETGAAEREASQRRELVDDKGQIEPEGQEEGDEQRKQHQPDDGDANAERLVRRADARLAG